jgi:precorrin-2 dehydrogenase / sirohydrochlorin ferrochelatase
MTRFGYPVALDVEGKLAVVIGRDAVAVGKVDALLAAGATVRVIADGPGRQLDRLESTAKVTVARRDHRPEDLDGAVLVVASSADPAVREAIFREGSARGALVNVMDDVEHCHFAAPALVRRGDLTIAISTGGGSPALARRLREELEQQFGEEWAEVLDILREVRSDTLAVLPNIEERSRRWQMALDTDELIGLVRAGRSDQARRRLTERLLEEGAA